jgi:hypothetical protein
MISPDLMYKKIVQTIEGSKLRLKIERKPINNVEFTSILEKKIKVLFLLCHGDTEREKPYRNYFCFEDTEDPTLMDKYDEEKLRNSLKKVKI